LLLTVRLVAQPTLLAGLDGLFPLLHPIRISYLQYLSYSLPGVPFFLTICYAVFQALGVFSLISSAFSSRQIIVHLLFICGLGRILPFHDGLRSAKAAFGILQF